MAAKEIAEEIGLSEKHTIKRDLGTLHYLGLVRKKVRRIGKEKEIVYRATDISPPEWEEVVEPFLKGLPARPTSAQKKAAGEELIEKLESFRESQKMLFHKATVEEETKAKRKFEKNIVVIPLGGVDGSGRSALYVKAGYTRFLLDVGQGIRDDQPFIPRFELMDEGLDFILVSHPHIDHIGCLPEVIDLFGDVPIYTTEPAREKIEVQLTNRASIESRVLGYQRRGVELLEDSGELDLEEIENIVHRRINRAIENFKTVKLNQFYKISDEVKVSFLNAGHLLEANAITISTPYENILYPVIYPGRKPALPGEYNIQKYR